MKANTRKPVPLTVLAAALLLFAGNAVAAPDDEDLGLSIGLENMMIGYSQEGGVSDYNGDLADFDDEFTPRVEIAFTFNNGLGIRARHWGFETDATTTDDGTVGVEASYLDLEVFHDIELDSGTEIEFSLGFRESEFEQHFTETLFPLDFESEFDGWGGTAALEGRRKAGIGKLYARARFSLLVGEHEIVGDLGGGPVEFAAEDNQAHQVELAFGYEFNFEIGDRKSLDVGIGAEWQQWSNVALADPNYGGIGNDDMLEDAGFHGFGIGVRFSF